MKQLPERDASPHGPCRELGDDWPECALCNKRVDAMRSYRDEFTCETVLMVKCHGDREEVRISDALLDAKMGMRMGRAFDRKALPTPQSRSDAPPNPPPRSRPPQ